MATNLLWFVMAGFLLGFATSTLWEWFYFRKERLKLTDRRIRELEAKLRDAEADADSTSFTESTDPGTEAGSKSPIPTVAAVSRERTRTSAWGDAAYRSPGVFLESEEFDSDAGTYEDAVYGPERPSSATPVVPTVDSISSKQPPSNPSTASPTTSSTISSTVGQTSPYGPPKSQPVGSAEPSGDATMPTTTEARPDARPDARVEQPTPADALRAKRATTGRSRQEVLAALRRNSEAVERGEYPPATRSSSLVSPFDPDDEALHEDMPEAPSEAEAPTLPPARLRWVNDAMLTARTKEYPDDLSKIRGIGDVYKQRLYRAGVYTWKQLVETDTETLRRATSAYPSSNVEEWLTQAQALMEKHGRKDAVYSGPSPDDMTKILGIGPVGAAVLYRNGICTYEQLASTPKADLEALFPIAVAGDMPDFAQWIERATNLADEKHRDK